MIAQMLDATYKIWHNLAQRSYRFGKSHEEEFVFYP